jgi:hypothetical protein
MAILERNSAAHLAVRKEGVVHPLCQAWRSSWNWTLERDRVTCPQCRAALAQEARDAAGTAPSR